VQICPNNFTWGRGDLKRTSTVVHELFHVIEDQNRWFGNQEFWGYEGGAEFVAWAGVIDKGLTSYQLVRDCKINNFIDGDGRPMTPLPQMNTNTPSGAYGVAWLAWDQLVGGVSGIGKMSGTLQGRDFQSTYGISMGDFEQKFADYRRAVQPIRGAATSTCSTLF
jgi:hypothetical protein